jgi:hypothetical protein
MLSYQLILVIISFIITYSYSPAQTDCPRHAYLEEFNNPNNTDYEKDLAEFEKCIREQLGDYSTFDPKDPKLVKAIEKCENLEPSESEYIYPSQIVNRLAQNLTEKKIHFILDPSKTLPEYVFTGYYEINLDEQDKEGKKIMSRLHIDLLYNGKYRELVKFWETVKNKNISSAHLNLMFDNNHSLIKNERPISKLLKEFEKPPVSCKMETEKDEVNISEQIKVDLKEFKDESGNQSREFNRILVQALEGKIINGTPSTYDEDLKVFEIGNESVMVDYQAPDNCDVNEDVIRVYCGCEIVGELSNTSVKKPLNEKKLKIICARGFIEYNHIIQINYAGFSQNMSVVGSIPFQIEQPTKGSKDKPKVKGEGEVNFSMNGQADECKWSGKTPTNVQLEGELLIENEEQYVEIKFNEKWPESWNIIEQCPDEEPETITMPVVMPVQYDKMKFKIKDGFNITRPFQGLGGEGTYSWTIRLPNSAE